MQNVDRPVISVGNLTTGGTGKSPLVAWIARQFKESCVEPMIAMRGYRASPNEMSDEQAEYHQLLRDPHVVANPQRAVAIRTYLSAHRDVRAVILDDGFQHRQIRRDLDLVLIDATANTFEDRLLPAGHLREPVDNLRRADAVIVTHAASDISDLRSQIEKHHGKPPVAWCRHIWTQLRVYDHSARYEPAEVESLRGKRVVTMLGVGKPESITNHLKQIGAIVAIEIPSRDHDRFSVAKLAAARDACKGCDGMIVTGKDWVKLIERIEIGTWPAPIVVPQLEIEFIAGEGVLRELILRAARAETAAPVSSHGPTG